MGNIPSERTALLAFAQGHYQTWIDNAASVGLSVLQAAAVQAAVLKTIEHTEAAESARAASRAATGTLSEGYAELRRAVGEAVRTINLFASTAADPMLVYTKAQIEPPRPRGESLPPTVPFELGVELDPSTGSLLVKWKAAQPQGVAGVVYTLRRRIGPTAPFTQLALTGLKRHVDTTIPAGTSQIAYNVQAQRGNQASPVSSTIEVRFGSGGGMTVTMLGPDGNAIKLAA